jgi:hypothetical protein
MPLAAVLTDRRTSWSILPSDANQRGTLSAQELAVAEQQCDPGVDAISSITGADLSSMVYSCPPVDCLSSSCTGYELSVKGVQGCLNTSAPVGSIFQLRFTVLDRAVTPPVASSAVRVVTILSPCDLGFTFCRFAPTVARSSGLFEMYISTAEHSLARSVDYMMRPLCVGIESCRCAAPYHATCMQPYWRITTTAPEWTWVLRIPVCLESS